MRRWLLPVPEFPSSTTGSLLVTNVPSRSSAIVAGVMFSFAARSKSSRVLMRGRRASWTRRARRRSWRTSSSMRSASARNVGCETRRRVASSISSGRFGASPVSASCRHESTAVAVSVMVVAVVIGVGLPGWVRW